MQFIILLLLLNFRILLVQHKMICIFNSLLHGHPLWLINEFALLSEATLSKRVRTEMKKQENIHCSYLANLNHIIIHHKFWRIDNSLRFRVAFDFLDYLFVQRAQIYACLR